MESKQPGIISDWLKIKKKPITDKKEFLYVIYNNYTKLIKIGITNDINRRVNELQTKNGVSLYLLFTIELEPGCDEPAAFIEDYLHKYFKESRKLGEWFELSLRQIVEIRQFIYHVDGLDIYDYFIARNYV